MDTEVKLNLTFTYVFGLLSCWFSGFGFWASFVWPFYIGEVFVSAYQ